MKYEFAEKMNNLADIIENRDIGNAKPGDCPTRFAFVKLLEPKARCRLECVWVRALSGRQKNNVIREVTITGKGFSAQEWRDLTEKLYDYL